MKIYGNKLKIMFFFLLLFTFVVSNPRTSVAQDGAEVPTKGAITLFDEELESSEEQTTPSSSKPSSEELVPDDSNVKPKGKLPSTGELINYGLISGGILVLIVGLFYFIKRRKNHDETNEGGASE
ncbi:LPXTG cell wall anchor domain-containing protein [Enterococcus sp. 5H]|uniref:LPXTG cell wall anchor domain-containing protein n=1 Tax=Enterococcus sp. 5H TaxID=1229490 RepID=UPI0023028EDD|nr:LPXTG cell wall anchor domain-containing protein [Enterococcus sp. 5H]MDA9471191.1 hypothetical protein [Enterococcus sp. 5H]